MPFVSLGGHRGERPGLDKLRIWVTPRQVVLRFPRDLVGTLGWQLGSMIDAQRGEGGDAGKLRLVPSLKGWKLHTPGGGVRLATIKIPLHLLPAPTIKAMPAEYTIDGDALVVWLPWAEVMPGGEHDPNPRAASEPTERFSVVDRLGTNPDRVHTDKGGSLPRRRKGIGFTIQEKTLAETEQQEMDRLNASANRAWEMSVATEEPPRSMVRATAPAPAPDEPAPIAEAVLKFLREEVDPVLAPLRRTVRKSRDGTGLLLDGKPVSLDELVAEANRILAEGKFDPIEMPSF